MPKVKHPEEVERGSEGEEEPLEAIPGKPAWSGGISMGLVNNPVRTIPITMERMISFRMLHHKCKLPSPTSFSAKRGTRFPRAR